MEKMDPFTEALLVTETPTGAGTSRTEEYQAKMTAIRKDMEKEKEDSKFEKTAEEMIKKAMHEDVFEAHTTVESKEKKDIEKPKREGVSQSTEKTKKIPYPIRSELGRLNEGLREYTKKMNRITQDRVPKPVIKHYKERINFFTEEIKKAEEAKARFLNPVKKAPLKEPILLTDEVKESPDTDTKNEEPIVLKEEVRETSDDKGFPLKTNTPEVPRGEEVEKKSEVLKKELWELIYLRGRYAPRGVSVSEGGSWVAKKIKEKVKFLREIDPAAVLEFERIGTIEKQPLFSEEHRKRLEEAERELDQRRKELKEKGILSEDGTLLKEAVVPKDEKVNNVKSNFRVENTPEVDGMGGFSNFTLKGLSGVNEEGKILAENISPSEKTPEQELKELSPEDKEKVSLGLRNLGFFVEEQKDKFFAGLFKKASGLVDEKGTTGRFLNSFHEIYTKDAIKARTKMEAFNKVGGGHLSNYGSLLGNVLRYGRIATDIAGYTLGSPLRYVMLGSMIFSKSAGAMQEARLKNEEVINKTRVEDIESAAEQAWSIYESAKAKNNGNEVSRENLEHAYLEGQPKDILERLSNDPEPGVATSILQRIMQKDVEYSVKKINDKIKVVEADTSLNEEQKQNLKDTILNKYSDRLKNFDRMVTNYGTVDALAMGAKYAQTAGKVVVYAMMAETVGRLAYKAWENLPSILGESQIADNPISTEIPSTDLSTPNTINANVHGVDVADIQDTATPVPHTPTIETVSGVTGTATRETLERGLTADFSVELGKNGVPGSLERVFHMMAVNHMDLKDTVIFGEADAAKSLNMAANLVKLAEGHNLADVDNLPGVDASTFSDAASWDQAKGVLEIKDHDAFNKIVGNLESRANILLDQGVLKTGAVANIDNITNETWLNILHADPLEKVGGIETGVIGNDNITTGQILDFDKSELVKTAEEAQIKAAERLSSLRSEINSTPEPFAGTTFNDTVSGQSIPVKEALQNISSGNVEKIMKGDIDKIFGSKGFLGFGVKSGINSPDWLKVKGLPTSKAVGLFKDYIHNISTHTGEIPQPNETSEHFIKRAIGSFIKDDKSGWLKDGGGPAIDSVTSTSPVVEATGVHEALKVPQAPKIGDLATAVKETKIPEATIHGTQFDANVDPENLTPKAPIETSPHIKTPEIVEADNIHTEAVNDLDVGNKTDGPVAVNQIPLSPEQISSINYQKKIIAAQRNILKEFRGKYANNPNFKAFENSLQESIDTNSSQVKSAVSGAGKLTINGDQTPKEFVKDKVNLLAIKFGLITSTENKNAMFNDLNNIPRASSSGNDGFTWIGNTPTK